MLELTAGPDCEFKFEVFVPKVDQPVSESARLLLSQTGLGVAGVAEGSDVAVTYGESVGAGWIDQAGELQSVIAPTRNWLVERNGAQWKQVDGQLHVITRRFTFEGTEDTGTYAMLAAGPLTPHSARLLNGIGIGVQGTAATVLVRSRDGRRLTGLVTPEGVATITLTPWEQR